MADELNPRQERFVQEYLLDLNGKQAAIRAGYAPKTAEVQASRLISDAKVGAAIAAAKEQRAARTRVSADRVLEELEALGLADASELVDWSEETLRVKAFKDLPAHVRRAISEISIGPGGLVKVKLHDKLAALRMIGQHLGMFTDRMELTGPNSGPIPIQVKVDLL